ncbi:hypothetical protein E3Q22_03224 [Wallemia mellicola]|uniref:Methyltransferase domain-containing protein n=1 Tax=Wallemia mellicola TaxID=1708541 RepID=A0A4T0M387_9BASI|nr:hypothetical protein E3Q22_03224 [Wallemia mellicola]
MATNVPHSDKHSRIQRSFMFEKSLIHILEDTSYDLDKVGDNCWRWQLVNMFQKLWDSGLAMSAILTEKISSEKYNFFGGSSKPLRIMELGTGTGILSITLAALLEKTPHKHTIVATDLAPALPLLKQNVDRNSRLFNKNDVFVRELAWGSQSPLEKEHFDVIIAADVAYNTSSFPMNAVAVTATPDKSRGVNKGFSDDEIDAILQSYLLDVDNKRKAMKLHLDRSVSAFTARSLSILASVPKALHGLTLGEFEDKFGGDLVRAVRGEGVRDAAHDLEDKDREEEWEAARKRKRFETKDGSQSPQPETKKSTRKNTRSKTTTSKSKKTGTRTRSTRSQSKAKEADNSDTGSTTNFPHADTFEPNLDELPDEAEVEAEVRANIVNNADKTKKNEKRRPSIQLVDKFGGLNELPQTSSNETRYMHDTATLFIPLPDGTRLAVDPARAEPEELNKLEGVSDEMRDIFLVSKNAAAHLCSDVRAVGISLECLASLNSLLDEVLARILTQSRSFRLGLIRRATLDVFPVGFGQNAITEAELKLQATHPLGSADGMFDSDRIEDYELDAAFKALRYHTILKSKYSDPVRQSISLAASLEKQLYQLVESDIGSIATAAIFVSAVLEHVAQIICQDLSTVVVRYSSKSEAMLSDLYDAIQENDRLSSLIHGMLVKDMIESQVKSAEERRRSMNSQVSRINSFASLNRRDKPAAIDTSGSLHRRSSSWRMFGGVYTPTSANSEGSITKRSSVYFKNKFKNSNHTETATENKFDRVIQNKQTLKLSLTPNSVDTRTTRTMSTRSKQGYYDDHLDEADEFDDDVVYTKPKESLMDFLNSTPPWEHQKESRSINSLPSSVDDEPNSQQNHKTAGLSDFSRDLIAFLNTEPPGNPKPPLQPKKSSSKFKSIFKSSKHAHNNSNNSILNTTTGFPVNLSANSTAKSSSSTIRHPDVPLKSPSPAIPSIRSETSLKQSEVLPQVPVEPQPPPQPQPQVQDKLPPIQSPLPMSTSFTRSTSPQRSTSPASYVQIQQSPKLSAAQAQQYPIPSSSSAIADQYAAAVLRRTQSSQDNLNLSPPMPAISRTSSLNTDEMAPSMTPSFSAPLPARVRSHSVKRKGKPATPRKPVPALVDVERGEKYQSGSSYSHNQSSSEKHTSTSTNGRFSSGKYSSGVQTMPESVTSSEYVHKEKLVRMHKIVNNAQTLDECKLFIDAFLKSLEIPTSIPSTSTSASMKPQSSSSVGANSRQSQQSQRSYHSQISQSSQDNRSSNTGSSSALNAVPIAPSIEENKSEEEKETQSEAGSASVSKISSPQQNHTVEIDHASSQSSLPQIIEREGSETNGGNLQSNATPTESATPITPTAATPYPSVSMKKGMEEHDDNFVTKWLMSDQQPHNGIQVELSDAI